jgi:hypothetical protein
MKQIRILFLDLDLVWIRILFLDPNWLRENRDQLKVWLRPWCRHQGMSELDLPQI